MNLLLVEDDLITAELLAESLREAGHHIQGIARSYSEVLACLQQQIPDALILDIHLPGSVDGIAIAQQLQGSHAIPFIFLTGRTEPELFRQAQLTGPVAYLVKPFRSAELHMYLQILATPEQADSAFLFVRGTAGKTTYARVEKKNILFAQADGNYTRLFVKGQTDAYYLSMNLGFFQRQLNPNTFYRLSRSVLINVSYVEAFTDAEVIVAGTPLVIPSKKKQAFLAHVNRLKSR